MRASRQQQQRINNNSSRNLRAPRRALPRKREEQEGGGERTHVEKGEVSLLRQVFSAAPVFIGGAEFLLSLSLTLSLFLVRGGTRRREDFFVSSRP